MLNTSQPLTATRQWLSSHNPISLSLVTIWAIASTTASFAAYFRLPLALVLLVAIGGGVALAWLLRARAEPEVDLDISQEGSLEMDLSSDDDDVEGSTDRDDYLNSLVEDSMDFALAGAED